MTSSSSASPNKAPVPNPAHSVRTAQPDPSREPPRKQSEARSAREKFSVTLEQSGERSTSGGDEVRSDDATALDRSRINRDAGGGSGGDSGSQSDHSFAQASQLPHLQAIASSTAAQPSGPSVDTAMLERMAAQIAESWPSAGAQQASITFPDGAIAQSAHIIREPDGSIAVRIAGLDPKLAAVRQAQLQLQLSGALERRRLKIASLQFEKADHLRGARSAVLGDESAIPRVV